jgi:hypothetical protein
MNCFIKSLEIHLNGCQWFFFQGPLRDY